MSYNNPIRSDDPDSIEKLTGKLTACKERQAWMKEVNAYYRKHGTVRGMPRMTEQMAEKLEASIHAASWDARPYPSFELANNNAEMHRLEKRIDQLQKERDVGFAGWKFDGGEAVANTEKRRLQLFFDEKPDESKRTMLKRYGFRWTPTEGAWQRLLNDNAIYACDRIDFLRPTDGQRPTQLQPKLPRSAEQER